MKGCCHQTKNHVMISYALYLLTGQTLLAKSIKVATVKLYLKAVVDYFGEHRQFNPTLDEKGNKLQVLESLYHEGSRWEKMPNRAEPLTPEMVKFLVDNSANLHPDSACSAYSDWAVLSLQTGFRISEYAQTHSAQHMPLKAQVALNIDGTSKAFIASDFKFLGHHRQPVAKNKRQFAQYVYITWRFQKNGNNGEEISFSRNNKRPDFCPVRAAYRIIKRAERLQQQKDLPIAICLSPTKAKQKLSYITSPFITKQLRLAAKSAHGLTSKEDLKKFTPHSPRVGACVLLDLMKHKSDYIKKRLRWRSDSYEDYLRHIPALAIEHAASIADYFSSTKFDSMT